MLGRHSRHIGCCRYSSNSARVSKAERRWEAARTRAVLALKATTTLTGSSECGVRSAKCEMQNPEIRSGGGRTWVKSRLEALEAPATTKAILSRQRADDAGHNADDLGVLDVNRRHFGVGRLQADAVLFRIPVLERRFTVVGACHDHVAPFGGVLTAHHDVVAVGDLSFDHRIAADRAARTGPAD